MLDQIVLDPTTPNREPLLSASRFEADTNSVSPNTAIPLVGSMQRRTSGTHFGIITCSVLLALSSRALAQAAFVFPSPVTVGGTSQVQTVPVRIQTAGTLGTVKVLTQGSPNLDFTLSAIESCPTSPGQVCNVSVSFLPKYPGVRFGAVVVLDTHGDTLASQSISGVGIGSLSVMTPGEISTLAGDGCLSDGACPTSGSTQATQSAINLPLGAATDAAGNLYISDTGNNRIERVDLQGNITTVAGSSKIAGSAGDGGPASSAQISAPSAITVDGSGNIFFADTGNNAIREINITTHNISTIAGTLGTSGSSPTLLTSPQGFAFDASGNLYIADTGNNRIRKVDTAGNVTSIPGTYHQPWAIAVSAKDGSLYIADFGSNRIIKVDTLGNVSTVAGSGTASDTGDGHLAINATLNSPSSVAIDAADNLYIADSENNAVRKVSHATGNISTLAGNGTALFSGDGFNANLAGLYKPYSVYLDGAGNLFIADRLDLRIRKVSATVAGIHYSTMKEGKASAPIAQAIENNGNAPLNLINLTASPATQNAALDTVPTDPITTSCSVSQPLATGEACVLAVEFMPVTVGTPGMGVLSITSDAGNSAIEVDLSGTVLSVDPSSTTVTSSSNPAAVNQGVTFTAKITSPNSITGTVQFFDGATAIGIPQTVVTASDTATIETSFTTVGTHIVTAAYSGDNLNAASTPNNPLKQDIEQATILSVISNANPAVEFSPITLNAGLTGWTTTPTGSITFTDGPTLLGAAALDGNGFASFVVPPLAVGKHNITAVFAGDANDFSSQYSFVLTVNLAPSSTTLGSSNAIAQFSTPITFTATVGGAPASTPTGNVVFLDGSSVLSTVPLNALGGATYVNTTLPAGTHTITAFYQGNSDYASSTSTQIITETIHQTITSTIISSSATNVVSGRPVTLTAAVTAPESTPGGTVRFMNGNVLIGTGILTDGVAAVITSTLPIGTNNVSAIYSGDSNNTTSTSPPIAITVVQTPSTTVISSSQSPLPTSTPVVLSATVSNGGTQSPTGLITFVEDSVPIGVGALNSGGVATIAIPFLTAGSHTFLASYAGDMLDLPSASPLLIQVVQLRSTTNVLTTSSSSLNGGQQLTLISVIRPTGTVASAGPTGNVAFMLGSTTLATTPLDAAGVATVTVLLSGTSADIASSYSGDATYAASSSSPSTVTIGSAPNFALKATPTSWQMQSKQHLAINVTLTSVQNFTDSFVLGCLGLPKNATCTFSQDKTNLPAGGAKSVTLMVDTGTPLLGGTQAHYDDSSGPKVIFACMLPGSLALCFLGFRVRRVRLVSGLLLLSGISVVTAGLSGCGSIQNSGTPPGTYSFLVTATGQTGVSQFTTMTMTITK